jgi:hypothetical protein
LWTGKTDHKSQDQHNKTKLEHSHQPEMHKLIPRQHQSKPNEQRLTSTPLQQIKGKPPSTPDTQHPDKQEHKAKEEYLQEKDSKELPTSPSQKNKNKKMNTTKIWKKKSQYHHHMQKNYS